MSLATHVSAALLAALAGARRNQPVDRDVVRCAAVELRARGLTPRDIAAALGLTEAAVRGLLEGRP